MAYKTVYPYTNEFLKEYENHTEADLEDALAKGHSLYKKWRSENFLEERKAQLHKVADLLRRDCEKYAAIMTYDMGKLLSEAKFEVMICADIADIMRIRLTSSSNPKSLKRRRARHTVSDKRRELFSRSSLGIFRSIKS